MLKLCVPASHLELRFILHNQLCDGLLSHSTHIFAKPSYLQQDLPTLLASATSSKQDAKILTAVQDMSKAS